MKDSIRQKLATRLIWLWWVVALGLIAGLLLSPKLWVSTRIYPLTPLFGLPPLPYPVDYLLFGLFGVLLVGAAVFRGKAAALLAAFALGLTLFFVLEDLSRLQPWFYQYSFMLAALCLYAWGRLRAEGALNACRLIMAGTYFWSGLQKANASFVGEVYPWLVEPIAERLPTVAWWTDALLLGAYAVPAVEAGIGLGLLVPRFRTPAIVVALSMHSFILFCLGPWGHDFNTVVV